MPPCFSATPLQPSMYFFEKIHKRTQYFIKKEFAKLRSERAGRFLLLRTVHKRSFSLHWAAQSLAAHVSNLGTQSGARWGPVPFSLPKELQEELRWAQRGHWSSDRGASESRPPPTAHLDVPHLHTPRSLTWAPPHLRAPRGSPEGPAPRCGPPLQACGQPRCLEGPARRPGPSMTCTVDNQSEEGPERPASLRPSIGRTPRPTP